MVSNAAMKKPTLRPATRADLAAVERLLVANSLPTVGVAEALPDFVVAEREDEVIGVVGLELCGAEYALLRSAAVDPRWRGRGVGRQLVEKVIANAESRGLRALYLLTTTAEAYFPAFGFAKAARDAVPDAVRRTAEFTDACPASATVMSLELGAVDAHRSKGIST